MADAPPRFESSDVVSMFPTLVWKLVPDAGARADLDRRIRAWIELTRGMAPLHPGESWQSDTNLQERDEFSALVALVQWSARGVLRFLQIGEETLVVTGLWVNVNAPGAAHRPHHHPNNFLSGVYYLDVPPGADAILFHDPRPQAQVVRPPVTALTAENTDQVVVRVSEGTLLLFPAWLQHSVDPNRGARERVSVSMNLMFQNYVAAMSPPGWTGGRRTAGVEPPAARE